MKLSRILTYLHGTTKLGIIITFTNDTSIYVYADASFAIHTSDRVSDSGLCVRIGSS
jgi:hypothetical protein